MDILHKRSSTPPVSPQGRQRLALVGVLVLGLLIVASVLVYDKILQKTFQRLAWDQAGRLATLIQVSVGPAIESGSSRAMPRLVEQFGHWTALKRLLVLDAHLGMVAAFPETTVPPNAAVKERWQRALTGDSQWIQEPDTPDGDLILVRPIFSEGSRDVRGVMDLTLVAAPFRSEAREAAVTAVATLSIFYFLALLLLYRLVGRFWLRSADQLVATAAEASRDDPAAVSNALDQPTAAAAYLSQRLEILSRENQALTSQVAAMRSRREFQDSAPPRPGHGDEDVYKAAFDSSIDGLFIMKDVLTDANPKALAIFGLPREAAIGRSLEALFPDWGPDGDSSGETLSGHAAAARDGEVWSFFRRLHPPEGPLRETEVTLCPLPGRAGRLLGVIRDVTEPQLREGDARRRATENTAQQRVVGAANEELRQANSQLTAMSEMLKDSERRYRSFVQNFQGVALRTSADLQPFFMHGAVKMIFGYEARDFIIGRPSWHEVIVPEDQPRVLAAVKQLLQSPGSRAQAEFRIRHRDGETRWVSSYNLSIYDSGIDEHMIDSLIVDITDWKKSESALQASERKYKELVDTANSLVIRLDASGNIRYLNPFAEGLLGLAGEQILGRPAVGLIIPEQSIENTCAASWFEDLLKSPDRNATIEYATINREGHPIWVAWTHAGIRDDSGKVVEILMTGIDITDRRNMEQSLIASQRAAEDANRAKSEFLANMSHEIRTPMNGIIGMAELMLLTSLTPEQKEYLDKMYASANSLLKVINDILEYSRIEARHLSLEPVVFRPKALIEGVIASLQPKARAKSLSLEMRGDDAVPDQVEADISALRQILTHLTDNAIKFTSQGWVRLSVARAADAEGATMLRFSVSDSGIGIEEDKRKQIFEVFTQVDGALTRQYGGTGLGLTLSRALVRLMGGDIQVESKPGEGSTFSFTVAAGPIRPAPEETVGRNVAATSLNILVAEDNPVNQVLARRLLDKMGHHTVGVTNGREAMEALGRESFDVVFMDVQMPEMDGLEATRRIRNRADDDVIRDVPIIALTAHATDGDRQRFLEAGMNDYLTKPFSKQTLMEALSRVCPPEPSQPIRRTSGGQGTVGLPGATPPPRGPWRDPGTV